MKKYLLILLILFVVRCDTENKSPCILQATYDSGPSSGFAFRKDGTFEWTNGGGLGVSTYEGRYEIRDSIITLDKIGFDKVIKSRRLLITSMQPWNKNAGGKYIIQTDDGNNLIDSIFIFKVYIDKRDSL